MKSPVICLHGWCCDACHFDQQVDYFSGSREIVSIPWQSILVDHPGPVDLELAARVVESACQAEDLSDPPILVGHSMGGMLAAMVAKARRLEIKGIVVIDATWPLDQAAAEFFGSFIAQLEVDFPGAIRDFFTTRLLSPDDDPGINADVIERVVQSDPVVGLAVFRDLQTPGRLPRVEDVAVPIMGISSTLKFLDRDNLLKHAPDAWYGQIVGSGHFLMQQAPDQLNAMLERFFCHI
ncbi:MAG: alpha/beta hydrolase [Phycisphaerales bacterium]|nr:alpha/beta hydrolase [Phycisphaerales bacterium]